MIPDNEIYSSHEYITERVRELKSVLNRLKKHGADMDSQRYRLNMIIFGMQELADKKIPSE